jgi:hypothetical protein
VDEVDPLGADQATQSRSVDRNGEGITGLHGKSDQATPAVDQVLLQRPARGGDQRPCAFTRGGGGNLNRDILGPSAVEVRDDLKQGKAGRKLGRLDALCSNQSGSDIGDRSGDRAGLETEFWMSYRHG